MIALKSVIVFRSNFLQLSETFISDHLRSLREYTPFVLCEKEIASQHREDLIPTVIRGGGIGRVLFRQNGLALGLERKIAEARPSLIHAHFLTDGVKVLPLAERLRLPLVVTAHGYDATTRDSSLAETAEGRLLIKRRSRLVAVAARIICVSDFIREELLSKGYPGEKLITIHLGVNSSEFAIPSNIENIKCGIVSVGRLVEKKGMKYLIEAYAKLPDCIRARHSLRIIGSGPLESPLKALATALNVKVEFLGALSRSDTIRHVFNSRVFCLPSTRAENGDAEGMPIAIMEALGLGTPVVIFSDQPMASILRENGAGALAIPRDTTSLAAELLSLCSEPKVAEAMGAAGRKVSGEHFNLRKNTARLEKLYDELGPAD